MACLRPATSEVVDGTQSSKKAPAPASQLCVIALRGTTTSGDEATKIARGDVLKEVAEEEGEGERPADESEEGECVRNSEGGMFQIVSVEERWKNIVFISYGQLARYM
jgi:hypothetical protein